MEIFASHLIEPCSIRQSDISAYSNIPFNSLIKAAASPGDLKSGSVTISTRGTPALL